MSHRDSAPTLMRRLRSRLRLKRRGRGRAAQRVSVPRTQVVMLAAVAGFLLGVAILYFDAGDWDAAERKLARSGAFVLWLALIAAQTMLWTLAFPPLLLTFRAHWRKRTSAVHEAVPSALVLVVLAVALAITPRVIGEWPEFLPHHRLKTTLLTGLASLAALIASLTIWVIRGRLEQLARRQRIGRSELRTYLRLRSDLERLLAFLGAVIGMAVLASAALRRVALLYGERSGIDVDFPVENVVLYGLVLSLLVALVYLPTFATLQQTGARLRDRIAPLPAPGGADFEDRLARRSTLDELLGLRVSASTSFRAGVAILSPLLASLTSLLPKLGGG